MKRKLAMLLILLLVGMSLFPAGTGFADTTNPDLLAAQAETPQEENGGETNPPEEPDNTVSGSNTGLGDTSSTASQERARENNLFNTGLDPLWSFVELKAPEQAMVGQSFDVEITVKNMGTGSAMFPEFRFTEEADGKELSHFTVVGGENGVYNTMLTEVKSGETKTFTITLKVNPETKELPEGSKYRINCAIASYNWQMDNAGSEKRWNAVQSFEIEVLYALTEPSFAVENVVFNPRVTADTSETTATFTLRNLSETRANNVVVTLEGRDIEDEKGQGEKNIAVRDLTSTKQLYNVSGKQAVQVQYQLQLNKNRKNNEMTLTVSYNGLETPQEIVLNMPFPLVQDNTGSGVEPKVIIERYNVEPGKVLAGNYVTLNLYVRNTNSLPVNNVSIQLEVPSETSTGGETVSSGTVFSPVNSSNTFYIDSIAGRGTALKTISMYVDPNATAKTYTVPVNMQYEGNDGTKYEASDNVNIPVTQESKVEVISSSIPTSGNVGEPFNIAMEFVNVGKVNLTNFKVALEGDIPGKDENVYYLGTFNAGESNEYTASIFPETEGTLSGNVVLSYIDGDNQEASLQIPFSSEIGPAIAYDPSEEMPVEEPKPSLLSQLKDHWLAILLGIVVIVQAVILIRIKRKAKAEEELIDD